MENKHILANVLIDDKDREVGNLYIEVDENDKPTGRYHSEIKLYNEKGELNTFIKQGDDYDAGGESFHFFLMEIYTPDGKVFSRVNMTFNENCFANEIEFIYEEDGNKYVHYELYTDDTGIPDESENRINGKVVDEFSDEIMEKFEKWLYLKEESDELLEEFENCGFLDMLYPEN